jgi:hypothetical protein
MGIGPAELGRRPEPMKNRFPREFYVPKGAVKVADKASSAVAYIYEAVRGGVTVSLALGFHGKADKPDFHYSYKTSARRNAAILAHFEGIRANEKRAADRRAERKAFANPYKVGEVLNTCWGYDQTNVEYFEVTEVRGKHVILRELAHDAKATGWAQERTVPMVGQYIGEPIRRLAQPSIKISDCRWASKTSFTEVAGVKIYRDHHTSSYA